MSSPIKSSRFPGLAFDRAGTRRTLRRLFTHLPATGHARSPKFSTDFTISDEFLLALLEELNVTWTGDRTIAEAGYEERRQPNEPSFNDLLADGWIQVVQGRIVIPVEYLRSFQASHSGGFQAFEWLQKNQYNVQYFLRSAGRTDFTAIVESLNSKELSLDELRSPRPEWVAERRWEQLCSELPPDAALVRWLEDWKQLRWPTFIPQRSWSPYALELFRSALFGLLNAELLAGWDDIHEAVATYMAHQ
jgi:hypothetical protein